MERQFVIHGSHFILSSTSMATASHRNGARHICHGLAGAIGRRLPSYAQEFSAERDVDLVVKHSGEANLRLGLLTDELLNFIGSANLAAAALEQGNLPMSGATGGVLKRSLRALTSLVNVTLSDVRRANLMLMPDEFFSVASLVADTKDGVALDARTRGIAFVVPEVDPLLAIEGNHGRLLAALAGMRC